MLLHGLLGSIQTHITLSKKNQYISLQLESEYVNNLYVEIKCDYFN